MVHQGAFFVFPTVKGDCFCNLEAVVAAVEFRFYIVSVYTGWLSIAAVRVKVEMKTWRYFKVMFELRVELTSCCQPDLIGFGLFKVLFL